MLQFDKNMKNLYLLRFKYFTKKYISSTILELKFKIEKNGKKMEQNYLLNLKLYANYFNLIHKSSIQVLQKISGNNLTFYKHFSSTFLNFKF